MIGGIVAETLEGVRDASRHDRFLRLITHYEPALRRLAGAYLERTSDREDLVQDIALALWKAIPAFRGDSSERTWLYRIAHNVAITSAVKTIRRGKREERISDAFEHPSSAPDTEHELLSEEKRRLLFDSIRSLPTVDRQLVVLHLEGLSYTEIERVTGLSQSAIATRLSRIRGRLRGEIQSREAEPR